MNKKINKLLKDKVHYKTIGIISILNMFLAVSALLKDILLTSYLGTNLYADVFLLAFFIVDMLGNNFIGYALGISSIPIICRLDSKGYSKEIRSMLITIGSVFIIIIGILVLILFSFDNEIMNLIAKGFDEEAKLLCIRLLRIIIPTMFFYPLIALGSSVLQANGKFTVAVVSSMIFNIVFIAAVAALMVNSVDVASGVYYLSNSLLVAVVLMFIFVFFYMVKYKITSVFGPVSIKLKYIKDIFKIFIPYFCMLLLTQAIQYIERYMASIFDQGSVSALNYAYRLAQFPVWVFVAAIGTVVFPMMSKISDEKSRNQACQILIKSIITMAIITIPMMLVLFFFRNPIVYILFKRGAFDDYSVIITSKILSGYALGILGQSIVVLCLRYYLVINELRRPLKILSSVFVLNIVLDLIFVKVFGLIGLGYGSAISNSICSVIFLKDIGFQMYHIKSNIKELSLWRRDL
jgi:putative peptidoglycan lipid II flippase